MSLLSVDKLSVRFGGIAAVSGVSLAVEPGQIVSVIGPNGAGKTTVFNAVTGVYEPTAGRVRFDGRELRRPLRWTTYLGCAAAGLFVGLLAYLTAAGVVGLWLAAVSRPFARPGERFDAGVMLAAATDYLRGRTLAEPDGGTFVRDSLLAAVAGFAVGALGAALVWRRSRRTPDVVSLGGIARTFQNIRLFRGMTARENVLVGLERLAVRRSGGDAAADELLAFVGLAGKGNALAGTLAYGDQRRLEIARALATRPKLLLLDEPAAGMNPSETGVLMDLIRRIRDRGVTVLLIEHHMSLVMGVSDRVAVIDYGVKIADGPPAEVSRDPKVIAAYLGTDEGT